MNERKELIAVRRRPGQPRLKRFSEMVLV